MSTKKIKSLILNDIKSYFKFKSDAEFARFLEIKPQTLSTWHSRNTFDTELIYAKCEVIDANWLLTHDGPMIKKNDEEIKQKGSLYSPPKTPSVITIDNHNRDNIVLVPQAVQAGYLQGGFSEPKFIQKLPTYRMPGLDNGVFRMFEVRGNSMFPTVPARSYVVGQFVEDWSGDIKDNQVYVIISQELEDGLVKRCINRISKYNNLICKSDNRREYPTQNVDPSSIREVWEVKLHLNFSLPDPGDLYDRMNDLEAEMQQIKRLMN